MVRKLLAAATLATLVGCGGNQTKYFCPNAVGPLGMPRAAWYDVRIVEQGKHQYDIAIGERRKNKLWSKGILRFNGSTHDESFSMELIPANDDYRNAFLEAYTSVENLRSLHEKFHDGAFECEVEK